MPLVVVIRGQAVQFLAAGAKITLAVFMTHASTCRVGRGKRGWKTDEKTRQVREEGWGDYKVDAGRQTNTEIRCCDAHPSRFQSKGQEVDKYRDAMHILRACPNKCNRVSSPSGDSVDIFAPARDSLNSTSSQQSMRLQRSLATSASKVCRRCAGASEGRLSPQPPAEATDQAPASVWFT